MSSEKKATGKNDDIESELSEAFSGSEVKMSEVPDDEDEEYSMTLDDAGDSLAMSTSLKQAKNGLGASLTSDKPKGNG